MKAAFWAMCIVAAVSVAACVLSIWAQGIVLDELDELCSLALESVQSNDNMQAKDYVERLENAFDDKRNMMEILASHEDLHDTATYIVDARVALECRDIDDAYQALMQLQGMLEHLREHESLSVPNLL